MKKILSFILLGLMCSIGNLWATVDLSQGATYDLTTLATSDFTGTNDNYWKPDAQSITYYANGSSFKPTTASPFILNSQNDEITKLDGLKLITGSSSGRARLYVNGNGLYFNSNGAKLVLEGLKKDQIIVLTYKNVKNEADFTIENGTGVQNTSAKTETITVTADGTVTITYTSNKFYITRIEISAAPLTFQVTYKANGGIGNDVVETASKISDCSFTAPTNKAFVKWNTAANGTGDDYEVGDDVTSDLTLYAQWADIYTVTYNPNGATGEPFVDNTAAVIAANMFTVPDGKSFAGWNTAADGTGTNYAVDAAVTSNLTLYAQWATIYGELIKAVHTGATTATVTGVVGGTIDKKTASDGKFGGKGQYFGLTLASGTFHTGDTLNVHLTTAGQQGSIVVYAEKEGSTSLYNTESLGVVGDNKFILPAAINGRSTIYICRTESNTWNGYVDFISVVRPMPIVSEAWESLTIDNGPTSYSRTGTVVNVVDAYLDPKVVVTKHVVYADATEANVDVEVEDLAVQGNQYVGHVIIGGAEYTITIAKLTSYTVTYMDGEVELGTEVVAANGHPAEFADYQYKSLYSFVGWYNNADLADEHRVTIASEIITAAATYYGKWEKTYASSINFEQLVLDNGKNYNILSQLGALGYATNMTNNLDSLDDSKGIGRNEPYLGQKAKAAGTLLNFRLAAGQTVKVKFGNVGATPQISINDGEYVNMTIDEGVYTHNTNEEATVSIKTVSDKTVVFKQIMIDEDIKGVILPSSNAYVTLSMNGWASYAANFAYGVSGATVYKAAYNGSDAVVLTEVVDAVVPANQGIILKGEEGATVTITPSDETASDFSGNGLIGVVTSTAALEGTYVLSTNAGITEFNPCQAGVMIPAHKAYISIPSNAPAVRIIFAENGATGINELEGAEKAVKFIENGKLYIQKDGVVYDATGAKVK